MLPTLGIGSQYTSFELMIPCHELATGVTYIAHNESENYYANLPK